MKKIIISGLIISILFLTPSLVLAQTKSVQQNGNQNSVDTNGNNNQVTTQNAVQTQNQGEETSLQISTQYLEQLGQLEGNDQETTEQIKTTAREQIQTQEQIGQQLTNLESRSGWMKSLFGPNYQVIKNLKDQIQANQLQIQNLTQLQTQLTNEADQEQISQAVSLLTEQNTNLEATISQEEDAFSLFGWLVRLFY